MDNNFGGRNTDAAKDSHPGGMEKPETARGGACEMEKSEVVER